MKEAIFRKGMVLAMICCFIGVGVVPVFGYTIEPYKNENNNPNDKFKGIEYRERNEKIITSTIWTVTITSPSEGAVCSGYVYIRWTPGGAGPILPIYYNVYCCGCAVAIDTQNESYYWNSESASNGPCSITVNLMLDEDLDGHGDILDASDTVHITVYNSNEPPVACYDCSDFNPDVDQTVNFDGSCSYDPDGTITDYYWHYTIGGGLPVVMGHGKTLSYSWSEPGNYQVTLEVTDDDDNADLETKDVSVQGGDADLDCSGGLAWSMVVPDSLVTGSFTVRNIGYAGSLLDWKVESYPSWGDWTFIPSSGNNLKPSNGWITIDVFVVAPDVKSGTFSGEVLVMNEDDSSDYELISVSLSTPKSKLYITPFLQFLQKYPLIYQLLQLFIRL